MSSDLPESKLAMAFNFDKYIDRMLICGFFYSIKKPAIILDGERQSIRSNPVT
jgi:hypothetical protein